MTEESIECPTCGRRSWHPKDVEHQWCAACERFHCRMFYRTLFEIVTVEPMTFICRMIASNGESEDHVFAPLSHAPLPADTLPGDICTGYINVNAAHRHKRFDGLIIHTIERQFRKDEVPSWEDLIADGTVVESKP